MVKESKTNVCIVGAGPAGAATSLMLSKMKIPHVIVDKATFPRDKICGDGLIFHVFKVLQKIDPKLLDKFIAHPAFLHGHDADYFVSKHVRIEIKADREQSYAPIFFGKRIDFDHFLVENLPSDYADIRLGNGLRDVAYLDEGGVEVTLSNGDSIHCEMVIGAEGVQSQVSKKLANNQPNTNKDLLGASISGYYEGMNFQGESPKAEIHIINRKMPLYFYIFPLKNGQANITLVGSSELISKHKLNLRTEVEHIINNYSEVKQYFVGAKLMGEWRGWVIPSNYTKIKKSGDRFLLIGDAAGLTNPFYKEGVGTSMLSGVIAAEHIERCLKEKRFDGEFNKQYDQQLETRFGKLLKVGNYAFHVSKYPVVFRNVVRLVKPQLEKGILKLIRRYTY